MYMRAASLFLSARTTAATTSTRTFRAFAQLCLRLAYVPPQTDNTASLSFPNLELDAAREYSGRVMRSLSSFLLDPWYSFHSEK